MADITTSDDVASLVRRFYRVAIPDEVLGPVFRAAGIDWEVHMPRITAFWERQLLDLPGYNGNMVRAHLDAYARCPYGDAEFARWLELWDDAVDERFAGQVAEHAKARARGAATTLQAAIARPSLPMVE